MCAAHRKKIQQHDSDGLVSHGDWTNKLRMQFNADKCKIISLETMDQNRIHIKW